MYSSAEAEKQHVLDKILELHDVRLLKENYTRLQVERDELETTLRHNKEDFEAETSRLKDEHESEMKELRRDVEVKMAHMSRDHVAEKEELMGRIGELDGRVKMMDQERVEEVIRIRQEYEARLQQYTKTPAVNVDVFKRKISALR